METILVATDYSAAATNAIAYAANLARHLKARLVLCHAYYMMVTHMEVPKELPGENELKAENIARLRKLADEITKNYGIEVTHITGPMPASDFLLTTFHQTKASLVVMGMRELSKLDQWLFGSTTSSVINEAAFPVIVVPENRPYSPLSKILVATDLQLHKIKSLALIGQLAQAYQGHVQLLHIAESSLEKTSPAERSTTEFENLLPNVSREYVFSTHKDITAGIKQAITNYAPDLLVMIPQHHDFWDIAFNKSNTRKLAFQSSIPLLAIPASTTSHLDYKTD